MTRPTVLVTRPAGQAAAWVQGLHARGWPAAGVPLIGIEPATDASALQAARQAVLEADSPPAAVMFVSPTAVQHFFLAQAVSPSSEPHAPTHRIWLAPWPESTLAVATGLGTARALRQCGVPVACIVHPPADARAFDSEHVWPLLAGRAWTGCSVWIVRGDGGRDWLGDRWREAGAAVHSVVAYRRQAPVWTAAEAALVQAACTAPARYVWLFSSSEGVRHLAQAEPASRAVPALATHPAIAESARACGFGEVAETMPTVAAVVACLESGTLLRAGR